MNDSLTLRPIGFIRTGKNVKFKARHQPLEEELETNVLELLPESGYAEALHDLEGFDRVWLLWWFHRNDGWRPMVLPPRGPSQRRGVFATRSPHRPNPLGLTPVRLLAVEKHRLLLGPCDLVDGTPVFDIKPYVPAYDSFPDASAGWIDEVDRWMETPAAFELSWAPLAATQAAWLRENWNIDFSGRLAEILSRDPSPHRTRRIRKRDGDLLMIGCGAWRAIYRVEGKCVTLLFLETGFPLRFLTREGNQAVPELDAQLAFHALWPWPDSEARGSGA